MSQPIGASAFDRAPRLIDVGDGHRIAVEILGHGPTIVLEGSGPGYGIDLWGDLPSRLADFSTVVVYDRLGVGYSEAWTPTPPTLERHADNLSALLGQLPVARPALIVGWSMGGMMAQYFASRYPQDVAGLLLLDPSILIEDQYTGMSAVSRWLLPKLSNLIGRMTARQVEKPSYKNSPAQLRLAGKLASGFGPRMDKRVASKLLDMLTNRADVHVATMKLARGMFRTTAEVARTIKQRGLPDVPVTVVLSEYVPAKTPKSTLSMLARMKAQQEAIAKARGYKALRLGDVSHQIPLEAPEACVLAVRDLLSRIAGLEKASPHQKSEPKKPTM